MYYFLLVGSLFLYGSDKVHYRQLNNNHPYIEDLFVQYEQSGTHNERIGLMQKIYSNISINAPRISENRQQILKNAYQKYGCALFPCLLNDTDIYYLKQSPQQSVSIQNLPPLYHQHATIWIKALNKSLKFIISTKKSTQNFCTDLKDFQTIKLITKYQDPCWHLIVKAANQYMTSTFVYSFFANGSHYFSTFPEDDFDLKKSCCVDGKFYFIVQQEVANGMKGISYNVAIMQSNQGISKEIRNFAFATHPHNSFNVTSLNKNGIKIPTLVQVDKYIAMQSLLKEEDSNIIGKSDFSSISHMSFTNGGRILWLEGCKRGEIIEEALIQAWDLESIQKDKKIREWRSQKLVRDFVFSPNGALAMGVYPATNGRILHLCDAFSGRSLIRFSLNQILKDYFFWNNAAVCVDCGNNGLFYINICDIQYVNYFAKKNLYNELHEFLKQKSEAIFSNQNANRTMFVLKSK